MKWLEYFAAAYLLASWGVNGVIHPLHYFRNAAMHAEEVRVSESEEGIVMELPQDTDAMEDGFLSFRIAEAKNYSFSLKLLGYSKTGQTEETEVKAWKGWNSVSLKKLWEGDALQKIVVPESIAEGIILESAVLSKYRRVDTGRMGYVCLSFLFLAVLWEGVWWIRKRYAK